MNKDDIDDQNYYDKTLFYLLNIMNKLNIKSNRLALNVQKTLETPIHNISDKYCKKFEKRCCIMEINVI
jgi:hypothetical protein